MTPGEIYFWTALPRVSAHLYVSSVLLVLAAMPLATIVAELSDNGNSNKWRLRAVGCLALAGALSWLGTLCPDDKQVQQIIKGEIK